MKTKGLNVQISDTLYKKLIAIAKWERRSQRAIVELALEMYISDHEKSLNIEIIDTRR